MRWSNVLVIFRREVRDQIRDRRTLFMIFVLPILLYPILGIGTAKLAEVFQETPRTVVVVGAEHLQGFEGEAKEAAEDRSEDAPPPLLDPDGEGFNPALFEVPSDADRLRVKLEPAGSDWSNPQLRREGLRRGVADAVVVLPKNLGERLREMGKSEIPIYYNSADEKSQITFLRVDRLLERWRTLIVEARREQEGKPEGYTEPVRATAKDVATRSAAGATVWARLFPFLLVMMALTGAFYPAVDLCAGEKERGTMETLLISPASRAEIVMGKFFTVMVFSMATALLNLASMGLTAMQLASQFGGIAASPARVARAGGAMASSIIEAPSLTSGLWMVLLLVPLAGFFSAVCLALAVMARSMKEGQYYMTPLYLVALPLIFITLAPGMELNLFTSLIPITGVSLLLKALMMADYAVAKQFFAPVMIPILVYGALALRWAVDQFRKESVLFREAERFDLLAYVRHMIRDRGPLPTPGESVLCFILMLVTAWFALPFLGLTLTGMASMQLGVVLLPPVFLAVIFTSDPARTLLLRLPSWRYVALGVALALTLNPLVNELRVWVEYLFPTPEAIKEVMKQLEARITDFGTAVLLLALLPAVCEEVAFRGFILSGLKSGGRYRSAIVLSAFLFGFMHVLLSLFQQLFNATMLGLVLGLLAIRSKSLLPGIAFHFVNNAMALVTGLLVANSGLAWLAGALYRDRAQGLYHAPWVVAGAIGSIALLGLLSRGGFLLPPSEVGESDA